MRHGVKLAAALTALLIGQGCKKEQGEPVPPPPPQDVTQPAPAAPQAPIAQQKAPPSPSPSEEKPAEMKGVENCNSDLSQPIAVHTRLTEECSPYTLPRNLTVDGWDLTIEPGVEIRIDSDRRIEVGYAQPGRLIARGTPEKPIRFVSNGRKEPGAWRRIALLKHAGGSTLEHVVIEHAGADNGAAVESQATEVRLKNVQFVGIRGKAFREEDKARTVEFADNDLSQAGPMEAIVELLFSNVEALQGTNQWPPGAVIQLMGEVRRDTQVPNAGAPYRLLRSLVINAEEGGTADLKIAPGVVFQVPDGSRWDFGISQHASLTAIGTAEQPIVWTRYGSADVGSWRGLFFMKAARPPVLEHVKIEYAGPKDGAALNYQGLRGLGKLTHATITKSLGRAIRADGEKTEAFEVFSHNTFAEVGQPTLELEAHLASGFGEGNTWPEDGLIDLKGNIRSDTALTKQSIPYRVLQELTVEGGNDVTPVTLTVEPGVVLQFGPTGRLGFGYRLPGVLDAVGTEEQPITFTAAVEDWKGLIFHPKGKPHIEHAIVEKVAPDRPGISVDRRSPGGSVRHVTFKSVKTPLRNCARRKLKVQGATAEPRVKIESRKGC